MADPIALSLHIGLNTLDESHYGYTGGLDGGENDAKLMAEIAVQAGFPRSKPLLTKEATADEVRKRIQEAAAVEDLKMFLLTFSGHGGRLPDTDDEFDKWDETWALYDRQMPDDEIRNLLKEFKRGTRVLVVSDSCHSGGVLKYILASDRTSRTIKGLSYEVVKATFNNNRKLYAAVLDDNARQNRAPMEASIVLLAACQEEEVAADGDPHSFFTSVLKAVWNDGKFPGDYVDFHGAISRKLQGSGQTPKREIYGHVEPAFEHSKPFSIP